jgi:ankyrin repeat protein
MKKRTVLLALLFLAAACASARARPRRRVSLTCANESQTPLTCAAGAGKTGIVREFLGEGTPINEKDRTGSTALHWAALGGHNDTVKFLLDRHANVSIRSNLGGTPLHWAAKGNHPITVALLLSRGADINARNNDNWTPLMIAAQGGNFAIAQFLLSHRADPAAKSFAGQTALTLAVAARHDDIARLLGAFAGPPRPAAPRGPPPAVAAKLAPSTAAPAAAPAAAAPAVSKAEMERMIADAVKKAQSDAAAKPVYRSDVDRPSYRASEHPDDYALVVGIESYSDLPQAQFAERDAAAVRSHLVALGYPERNIVSLMGSKATKTGLIKNLETWLPENVNEKSTVFVYYSGHGAPDPKSGQSYLVPWDGDPQFLDDTAYPVARLYQKLGALKAKRVIIALDSCFSGTGGRSVLAKGLRPLVLKADTGDLAAGGKLVALSASGGDQVSGTAESQGHGLFTYYLLKSLNDRNGQVTVRSLFDDLRPKVQDEARRQNRDQTPQLAPAAFADGAAELR